MTVRGAPAAVAALLVAAAALVVPAPAATAGAAEDCRTVNAGPVVERGDRSTGYFDLELGPGDSRRPRVLLANPTGSTCRVRLRPAVGHTAVNSGNTYLPIADGAACTGSSCWLSGLPRTVAVPAGGRIEVPFEVEVPDGTVAGQYLAGVVAEPADAPPAPPTAPSGEQGAVSARVVAVVALGVAVTVPGRLAPAMAVAEVRVDPNGPQGVAALLVTQRNTGNTFERPRVEIVVETPAPLRFTATSATVLPGNSAVLSVPMDGVPAGAHRTRVQLGYGDGRQAVFDDVVQFPAPPSASVDRNGNLTLTRTAVPGWVWWALGVLAFCVLALAGGLLLAVRGRRGTGDGAGPRRLPFLPGPRRPHDATEDEPPGPVARHSSR